MSKSLLPSPFVVTLLGFLAMMAVLPVAASAHPVVTIISPKNGISAGAPVFFEAYATSAGCTVESMSVWPSPSDKAYTVSAGRTEVFLTLAPGNYQGFIQAYDDCGNTGQAAMSFTVNSSPGVSVFLPKQISAAWPVHVAASAISPNCAQGIAALRIYTDPYITPYTVGSNVLDAYVNLRPGTYEFTVQAWDKCGNVLKSQRTQVVTGDPDSLLYATFANSGAIGEYEIEANGALKSPNGTSSPPIFPAAGTTSIAVDPGGWYLYASSSSGIYAFEINRSDGALVAVPGSPFPYFRQIGDQGSPSVIMDPSGNFLYVELFGDGAYADLASYRINRSDGTLSWTGWDQNWGGNTQLGGITTDFTGQFIYVEVLNFDPNLSDTYIFQADPNEGHLTQPAGTPFPAIGWPASTADFLYLGTPQEPPHPADILGYSVSDGSHFTELSQSPYADGNPPIQSLWADWKTRFVWAETVSYTTGEPQGAVQPFAINRSTGNLSASGLPLKFPSNATPGMLVEDQTGRYLYINVNGAPPPQVYSEVNSYSISPNGSLQKLNSVKPPDPLAGDISSIAVVRKTPQ